MGLVLMDQIKGLETNETWLPDDEQPQAEAPWMEAFFEAIQKREQEPQPLVLYPYQRAMIEAMTKHSAPFVIAPMRVPTFVGFDRASDAFEQLGSALERASAAVGGLRASYVIFDELSRCERSPWGVEPLPKKKRDWDPKQQRPPVQAEQKQRPKGVVMMRDRTGKLVERKL
jgi:hypothetical protein